MKTILIRLSSFILLITAGIIFFVFDNKKISTAFLFLFHISLLIDVIDSSTKYFKTIMFLYLVSKFGFFSVWLLLSFFFKQNSGVPSLVIFFTGIDYIVLEVLGSIFTYCFSYFMEEEYGAEPKDAFFKGYLSYGIPKTLFGILLIIYAKIVSNHYYDAPKTTFLANIMGIICMISGIVYLVIFILGMKNYIKAKQIKESFEENEKPEEN
ncbi:MAG: hypothetical protein J6Y28_05110 [Acholeplasmatales bacterium]|nr:hypothetical protein [Acholeplasmatales bacterium]